MKNLLFFLFIFSSCSSLDEKECKSQNWFKLGVSDAIDGVIKPKTADYRSECAEHGIQIKSLEYLKGFETGLKEYCTSNNGLRDGENGEDRHHLCEEVNPGYAHSYKSGRRKFEKIEMRKKLIEDNGGQECSSDSDCEKRGRCTIDKQCADSGDRCRTDSDCVVEVDCKSVSAWTDSMDNVSVNVCDN